MLFILLLSTAFQLSNVLGEESFNITVEEANQIALAQAKLDGLNSPVVWKGDQTEIHYKYSVKYEKDMKVYVVYIKTADRPDDYMYNAFYYVNPSNGEIIESTH